MLYVGEKILNHIDVGSRSLIQQILRLCGFPSTAVSQNFDEIYSRIF